MKLKVIFYMLFVITALGSSQLAAESGNILGYYGFDWLHPKTAKCRKVDEDLMKKLRQCELSTNGSFSGRMGHYRCKMTGSGEFLAYESQVVCQDEFETMEANGP